MIILMDSGKRVNSQKSYLSGALINLVLGCFGYKLLNVFTNPLLWGTILGPGKES